VDEGTGPITYSFYKEKEKSPFYQSISNETQAFWHKEQASKKEEGQYYCTASNRASLTQKSTQSNTLTVKGESGPRQNRGRGGSKRRAENSALAEGRGWRSGRMTEVNRQNPPQINLGKKEELIIVQNQKGFLEPHFQILAERHQLSHVESTFHPWATCSQGDWVTQKGHG
jgi:hypothetical protein